MQLSHDFIRNFLAIEDGGLTGDWDWASEYGEPGYSVPEGGMVVLGYYWCKCGKNPHTGLPKGYGQPDAVVEPGDLHSFDAHHPEIWRQMESQGYQFEWHDEWTIDHDYDKAYRTQGDSYDWQPSAIYTEHGDLLTPDDDIETWIDWLTEESAHRCLPSRIYHVSALEAVGFVKHNGQFENGWHPGQDDDPKAIVDAIREDFPDDQIVFVLDYNSQFYSGFSAYHRPEPE